MESGKSRVKRRLEAGDMVAAVNTPQTRAGDLGSATATADATGTGQH